LIIETKGTCITALKLHALFPHTHNDIIVGDSEGTLNIISRQRSMFRRQGGAQITCLEVCAGSEEGLVVCVAGDAFGTLTGFDAFDTLWRLQVGGISPANTTAGIVGTVRE
jgi:hypothetical protein